MVASDALDRRSSLTKNQWLVVVTAAIGSMLEFWDQYLIAFILAFVIRPWNLSFGTTAIVLLSSGVGGIFGGLVWGYCADRFGRKPTFVVTILAFSAASLALAFTPDKNWLYLAIFRAVLGFGTGGFFVPVTLVQELIPATLRGRAVGIVSATTSGGLLMGALCGAFVVPLIGWRGMFAVGALPALFAIFAWLTLPESPRWAALKGKLELARTSLGWSLETDPAKVDLTPFLSAEKSTRVRFSDLLRYPRSLVTGILINLGVVTGYYGFVLWAPTLLTQVQGWLPAESARVMIAFTVGGIIARVVVSNLVDPLGRKRCGGVLMLLSAAFLMVAAFTAHGDILSRDLFWLPLLCAFVLADGYFMVNGLYTSEIWPSRLRGLGSGVSFAASGVGKIIGPLGLALVAGSANLILPKATIAAIIPSFAYLAGWFVLVSVTMFFIGMETKGRTLEQIESDLTAAPQPIAAAVAK